MDNIAYCGLDCSECKALIATMNGDDAMRREVAAEWSREYQADIKPEDINCQGCLTTDGVVFHHCTVCPVRLCGLEKGVINCAYCEDYACDKLDAYFEMAPVMRNNLEKIRSEMK